MRRLWEFAGAAEESDFDSVSWFGWSSGSIGGETVNAHREPVTHTRMWPIMDTEPSGSTRPEALLCVCACETLGGISGTCARAAQIARDFSNDDHGRASPFRSEQWRRAFTGTVWETSEKLSEFAGGMTWDELLWHARMPSLMRLFMLLDRYRDGLLEVEHRADCLTAGSY